MQPMVLGTSFVGGGGHPLMPDLSSSYAIGSTAVPEDTYLLYAPSADWNMGNGPVTVEGWAWVPFDRGGSSPRLFSLNDWPTCPFGISVEGSQESPSFYFWYKSNTGSHEYTTFAVPIETWFHFAAVRQAGELRFYINGELTDSIAINLASTIGNATDVMSVFAQNAGDNHLNTWITDLHIIKGVAKYSSSFGVPSAPIVPVTESVLLLQVDMEDGLVDTSGKNHVSTIPFTGLLIEQRGPF